MQLIQNGTQLSGGSSALPAPASPSGTPGWANNATPGPSVVRTVFDADVGNSLIAEVANLVLGAGIALVSTDRAQALQAIARFAGTNTTFLSAATASSFTLTADNAGLITVDATAGPVTVTLPAPTAASGSLAGGGASVIGLPFRFTRLDASTNSVTIAAGSAIIYRVSNGSPVSSVGLDPYGQLEIRGDGAAKWFAFEKPAHGQQIYGGTSGTWYGPNGVDRVFARVWDAGAGGGAYSGSNGGSGGGGGGYFEGWVPCIPGASYAWSVATGGAAGAAPTSSTSLDFAGGSIVFATQASPGAAFASGGGTIGQGGHAPTVTGLTGVDVYTAAGANGLPPAYNGFNQQGGQGGGAWGGVVGNGAYQNGSGGNGASAISGGTAGAGGNGLIILSW